MSGNIGEAMLKLLKKIEKLHIIWGIIALVLLLGLGYTYVLLLDQNDEQKHVIISNDLDAKTWEGNGSIIVEQTFIPEESFSQINIKFSVTQYIEGTIKASLQTEANHDIIEEWEITADEANDWICLNISPVLTKANEEYSLILSFYSNNSESYFFFSGKDYYEPGKLSINNEEQETDLVFKVITDRSPRYITMIFGVIAVILVAGLVLICLLNNGENKKKLEKKFIIAGLFLGIVYLIVLPIYTSGDEEVHVATVFYQSNKLLMREATDIDGYTLVRKTDMVYSGANRFPTNDSYEIIGGHLLDKADDDMVPYVSQPLHSYNIGHFPAVFGVTLARLLGLGGVLTFIIGKLFTLFFHLAAFYWAIKIIPKGKQIIMLIGLLPLTLQYATSFSYDAVINSLSIIFVAYLIRMAYDDKPVIAYTDIAILCILLTLICTIKITYIFMGLLVFVIPSVKFGSKRHYLGIGSGMIFSSGLIAGLVSIGTILRISTTTAADVSSRGGYTLGMIIKNPVHIIKLFYNTFRDGSDAIFAPLFGRKIGYWDIDIPWYLIITVLFIFILSCLLEEKENIEFGAREKLVSAGIVVLTFGATAMAMLLDFTTLESHGIQGINGRYFIPILPFVGMFIQNKAITVNNGIKNNLVLAAYLGNYFILWRIFETVICR